LLGQMEQYVRRPHHRQSWRATVGSFGIMAATTSDAN
jgi:hypothetical protein